jgi:hypothetical protein
MKQTEKLKPVNLGRSMVVGIILLALFFSVFALVRSVMAKRTADILCGIMYIGVMAVCLVSWVKARQVHIIPVLLMNMMLAVFFFTGQRTLSLLINISLLILVLYMIPCYFRHEIKHRRILELAARNVSDARNGFTPRPFPSGKAEYSKGELYGLSEFLRRHLIAVPFVDSGGIALTIPDDWLGRLYNLHGHYLDDTRVIFQFNGEVSAHITEKDYKKYREEWTFDQLCAALGSLFIEFIELYKDGDGERILDRISGKGTAAIPV